MRSSPFGVRVGLNVGADQLALGLRDKVYLMSNVDSTMESESVSKYILERLSKWGKYGHVFSSKKSRGKYTWYYVQFEPEKKRK